VKLVGYLQKGWINGSHVESRQGRQKTDLNQYRDLPTFSAWVVGKYNNI
jgi:hypothetical protein